MTRPGVRYDVLQYDTQPTSKPYPAQEQTLDGITWRVHTKKDLKKMYKIFHPLNNIPVSSPQPPPQARAMTAPGAARSSSRVRKSQVMERYHQAGKFAENNANEKWAAEDKMLGRKASNRYQGTVTPSLLMIERDDKAARREAFIQKMASSAPKAPDRQPECRAIPGEENILEQGLSKSKRLRSYIHARVKYTKEAQHDLDKVQSYVVAREEAAERVHSKNKGASHGSSTYRPATSYRDSAAYKAGHSRESTYRRAMYARRSNGAHTARG